MKIKLETINAGTIHEFENKEELIEFAKRKLENVICGNDEQEKLKWDLLEGRYISTYDICELLKGSYKRIY